MLKLQVSRLSDALKAAAAFCGALSIALPAVLAAQSLTFTGVQSTVPATGIGQPGGVAVDSKGDLFIADIATHSVVELMAAGQQVTLTSDLQRPTAVAVDGSGNVYIVDSEQDHLIKLPAGGGSEVSMGAGLVKPLGVAVDGAGALYVADSGNNRVVRISAANVQGTFMSGLNRPSGVAVDRNGNVFAADTGNNGIVEGPASNGPPIHIGTGLSFPEGVAVDLAGNVFIADTGHDRIVKVAPGGTTMVVGSGFSSPTRIALGGSGNLFIPNETGKTVDEVQTVSVDFGSQSVCPTGSSGSTSSSGGNPAGCSLALRLNYFVNSGGDLGAAAALTVGAPNLDFTILPGGTCTGTISAGDTCTVDVQFTPLYPGSRRGAAELIGANGELAASTAIHGVGIGPQVAFPLTARVPVAQNSSDNLFSGMAIDGAGNLYTSDDGDHVRKYPSGGGTPSTFFWNAGTLAVAIDGAGNLYVASESSVTEFLAVGGAHRTVSEGLSFAHALAVDGAGNLFIADGSRVVEVSAGSDFQTTVATNVTAYSGITVDAAGNLLITDNTQLLEVPAGGGTPFVRIQTAPHISSVAVDAAGDIFLAKSNLVQEYSPNTPNTGLKALFLNSGFAHMIVDASGDLYFVPSDQPEAIFKLPRSQPTPMAFADTPENVLSADSPRSITIQNGGNAPLSITSIAYTQDFVSPPGGSAGSCGQSTYQGGESCVIGVDFRPSSKLSGAASVALAENIALTTNSLNVAGSIENIPVTGVELLPLPVLMLTASPKPVVFGKTLTITLDAGASSGGVAPTGMVTFFSNGIKIGSAYLGLPPGRSTGGSSSATIQTSTLQAGAYNLTATYPGDAAYGPAISNQVFLLVNQATPGLSFSPPPPTNVTLGSQVPLAVAFSNTVTNTPPKGTVTFTDGGTTIKTVDVIAGAASFTAPAMRLGSHTWMATYSGDDNYLSSSTPALTVGVGRIGTSITLTTSVATNRGGTSFHATASLTSPAGTVPTLTLQSGTITFYENGVSVGAFTLPVTAPIAVGPLHLARGAYQIEAIYSGDSNYLPATSNVVTLTVP